MKQKEKAFYSWLLIFSIVFTTVFSPATAWADENNIESHVESVEKEVSHEIDINKESTNQESDNQESDSFDESSDEESNDLDSDSETGTNIESNSENNEITKEDSILDEDNETTKEQTDSTEISQDDNKDSSKENDATVDTESKENDSNEETKNTDLEKDESSKSQNDKTEDIDEKNKVISNETVSSNEESTKDSSLKDTAASNDNEVADKNTDINPNNSSSDKGISKKDHLSYEEPKKKKGSGLIDDVLTNNKNEKVYDEIDGIGIATDSDIWKSKAMMIVIPQNAQEITSDCADIEESIVDLGSKEIQSGNIFSNESTIKFTMIAKFHNDSTSKPNENNKLWYYKIPEGFDVNINKDKKFTIYEEDNTTVKAICYTDGKRAYFEFDKEWLKSHNSDIKAKCTFEMKLINESTIDIKEETITIIKEGEAKDIVIKINPKSVYIQSKKKYIESINSDNTINYRFDFEIPEATSLISLEDEMDDNLIFIEDTFKFDDKKVDVTKISENKIEYKPGHISKGKHHFTYKAKIKDPLNGFLSENDFIIKNTKNKIYIHNGSEVGDSTIEYISAKRIIKEAKISEDKKKVTWTVTFNNLDSQNKDKVNLNLSNCIFRDEFINMKYPESETIKCRIYNEDGKYKDITLNALKNESKTNEFTVTLPKDVVVKLFCNTMV